IVKVQARALPDARSATTLGAEREGTGVVIDKDGLILTIGYLVIEADEVRISDDRGRTLPAVVVGYDHASGLALVRSVAPLDGALLGVGSLILRDATAADPHLPGNMFVPVELLTPILPDLVKSGRRAGPARPWLGVAADEIQGRLLVTRVSPEGPADRAGVHV